MNPTEKAAWIAALHDRDRYQHGVGMLYDPNTCTHCCFGVLIDINFPGQWGEDGGFEGRLGSPPKHLIARWGLDRQIDRDTAIAAVDRALKTLGRPYVYGENADLLPSLGPGETTDIAGLLMNVNDGLAMEYRDFEIQALLIDELL